MENPGFEFQEVSDFLMKGIELEAKTLEAETKIREISKSKYRQEWLDARLGLLSVSAHLLTSKDGVPGITSLQISERLTLIMVFLQGASVTEILISEGMYIKATAALKQEIEILARISEVKSDVAKSGKTPNVKHAPEGCQKIYGQLNDVAHPSNLYLLEALLSKRTAGEIHGISYIPTFVEESALGLYELHVWLIFEAVREHLILFMEMYGEKDPAILETERWMASAVHMLERAGFQFQSGEAEPQNG